MPTFQHTFTTGQETYLASADDSGVGPTLAEAQSNYSSATDFDPTDNNDFQVIDGYQWIRIPYTGIYEFELDGASGGINTHYGWNNWDAFGYGFLQWVLLLQGMLFQDTNSYYRPPGSKTKFRIKLFENQWIGMVVGQTEDCDLYSSDNISSASGGGGTFLFSAFDFTEEDWHVNTSLYGNQPVSAFPAIYHSLLEWGDPIDFYNTDTLFGIHMYPLAVAGGAGGYSLNIGTIYTSHLTQFNWGVGQNFQYGGSTGEGVTTSQSGVGYGSVLSLQEPNMASGGAGWQSNATADTYPDRNDYHGSNRPKSLSVDPEHLWSGGRTGGLQQGAKGSRKSYLSNLNSLHGGFGGGGAGEGSPKDFNDNMYGITENGGGGGFSGGARTSNRENRDAGASGYSNPNWRILGAGGGSFILDDLGYGDDYLALDGNNMPITGLPEDGYEEYPYDAGGYGVGYAINGNLDSVQGRIQITYLYIPEPPPQPIDAANFREDIDLDIESGGIKWGNGETDWWRSQGYDSEPSSPLSFSMNNEGMASDNAVITLGWYEKQTIAYSEITTIKAKRESEDESAWRVLFNLDPDTNNPPAVPGTCYNYWNLGNDGPTDTVEWTQHFIYFEFPLTDGNFNPDFPPGDDWVFSVDRNQASDLTWPVTLMYSNYDNQADDLIISEDMDPDHWGSETPKLETLLKTTSSQVMAPVPYKDKQEDSKLEVDQTVSPTKASPKDSNKNSELEILTQLETVIQAIKHIYSNVDFDVDGVPDNLEAKKELEKTILDIDSDIDHPLYSPEDTQKDSKLDIDSSIAPSSTGREDTQEYSKVEIGTNITPSSTPPKLDDNEGVTIIKSLDSLLVQINAYKTFVSKTEFDIEASKETFYKKPLDEDTKLKVDEAISPTSGQVVKDNEKTILDIDSDLDHPFHSKLDETVESKLNLSSDFPDDLFSKLANIDNTEDSKLILNSYLLATIDIIKKLKTNVAMSKLVETLVEESEFKDKKSILKLDESKIEMPLHEWFDRQATTVLNMDETLSPTAKDKLKDKVLDALKIIDGMQTPSVNPGIKEDKPSQLKILTSILTILNFRPQILDIISFDYNATAEQKEGKYSKEKTNLLLSNTTEPIYYDANRTKEFENITIIDVADPGFKDKLGASTQTFLTLSEIIEQAFGDWLDTAKSEKITIADNSLDELFSVAYSSFSNEENSKITINGEMVPTHHDTQYVYDGIEAFVLSDAVDKTMFALKKLLSIVDLDASPSLEAFDSKPSNKEDNIKLDENLDPDFKDKLKDKISEILTIDDFPDDSIGSLTYDLKDTDLKTEEILSPFLGELLYRNNNDSTQLSITQSIFTFMGLVMGKGRASLIDFIKEVSTTIKDPKYDNYLARLILDEYIEPGHTTPKDSQKDTDIKLASGTSLSSTEPIKEPIPIKLNILENLLLSMDPVFELLERLDFDFNIIKEEFIGEFKNKMTELKSGETLSPDHTTPKFKDTSSESNIGEVLNPFLGEIAYNTKDSKLKLSDSPQESLGSIIFRNDNAKLKLATNFLAFIGKNPRPLDIIDYVLNIMTEINEAKPSFNSENITLMDNALELDFAIFKESLKNNIDQTNLKTTDSFDSDYTDPVYDDTHSGIALEEELDPSANERKSSNSLNQLIISSEELKQFHDKESEKRHTKLKIIENLINTVNALKKYASTVDIEKATIIDKHEAYERYKNEILTLYSDDRSYYFDKEPENSKEQFNIQESNFDVDKYGKKKSRNFTNLNVSEQKEPTTGVGRLRSIPDTLTLFEILYASFRAVRDSLTKVDIQASENLSLLSSQMEDSETILQINSSSDVLGFGDGYGSIDIVKRELIQNISEITNHVLEKLDQLQHIDSMLNAVIVLDEKVGVDDAVTYTIPFADKQIGSVGGKVIFPWRINTVAEITNIVIATTSFTQMTEFGTFVGNHLPIGSAFYLNQPLTKMNKVNSIRIEYVERIGAEILRDNKISFGLKRSSLGEVIPICCLKEGESIVLPLGTDIYNSGIDPTCLYIKAGQYDITPNVEQYVLANIRILGTL